MEIITRQYEVFHFAELNDTAKERVKQDYLNDDTRTEFFTEDCLSQLHTLFPNSDLQIQYSLCNCQGDGFNIYGTVALDDLLAVSHTDSVFDNNLTASSFTEKEIRTLKFYERLDNKIRLPQNRWYSYCAVDRADILNDWLIMLECNDIRDINEPLIARLQNYVIKIFQTLCRHYETTGYKYFYEIKDNELNEICEENNWRFLCDGSFFAI